MTNPYRSPEGIPRDASVQVGPLLPGARATLVARGLLYRRLAVAAPLEITLEFHGRSLVDRVLVNEREVVRKVSWWRIAPRLAFTLPSDTGVIHGLVEIRVWPWLALRGFRVSIADHVVYSEGKLKTPVTSTPLSSRA
jgi:hypothetical protein